MSTELFDINNFRKQKKIGQGGFSEVYRVIEKNTNIIYAAKVSLKIVNPKSPKEMVNITREVNILSKLVHPCIIRFIGYSSFDFNHDNRPVIVTEYSQNGSLGKILELERSGRSLPEWDQTKKLVVIYGIAAGMEFLHSHDIIHRDLKPDNIFLDEYLLPKIADFGLSKFINSSRATLTSVNTLSEIKGTPLYMAPEILREDNNIRYTKASDVYSFSLIVYEIVTSIIPFEKYTISQLIQKVAFNGVRPEFKYPVPKSYRKLIEECWAQKPSIRPSFQEIVDKLVSDPGFITDGVDNDDFFDYVEYVQKSLSSYDPTKEIIKFTRVKVRSPENALTYPYREFAQLSTWCQKLVREADEDGDVEKQFIVGKSIFEGTISFPKNSELGINYLIKAIENGSIKSTIYYCRILIEGKLVPPNPEKAEEYLFKFCHLENPTIYTLIGKAKLEEGKYDEAIRYFLDSSSLGNAEATYEYGKMFLNGKGVPRNEAKANHFIEMAKRGGYEDEEEKKKLKIIKQHTFDKLNESCKNNVRSAETGDEITLIYVVRGFLEGINGFPQKTNLGLDYLKYGYKLKNVELMQLYGSFLLNGNFVPKSEEKGITVLNEAATLLNNNDMKLRLINQLLSKQNFDVNSSKNNNVNFPLVKRICKEAADSGCTKAMILYATLCMKNKKNKYGEINSDFKEAFNYFKQAADNGDSEGMALYGRMLDYGYGIEKPNKEEAFSYYKKSYKKGDLTGYTFYGSLLIEGADGVPKNESAGLHLVELSCNKGNAYGMANYGYFLAKGTSKLTKDVNKSLHYYKMAANLGCPVAFANLGVNYRDGVGTKKDVNLAIKYFEMAIEEGYPRAAFVLGNLLIKGDEESLLKPDFKKGYKYIQYAADHGIENAIYLFAYSMYYKKGIKLNTNLLLKYLLLGIKFKHPACMKLFEKILMDGETFPEDKYQGINNIKKAIELGDEKALESYADALEKGEIVMTNEEEDRRLRERAMHSPKKHLK